jgi:hypothetical protein
MIELIRKTKNTFFSLDDKLEMNYTYYYKYFMSEEIELKRGLL